MKWSARGTAVLIALALAGGSAMTSTAEIVSTFDDRELAALGTDEPNAPVWSTSIAAYWGKALIVHAVRPSESGGDNGIGYSVRTEDPNDPDNYTFSEGLISQTGIDSLRDPTVIANSSSNGFLVTAVDGDGSAVYTLTYLNDTFGSWNATISSNGTLTRPTIERGTSSEYYLIASEDDSGAGFAYAHTTNSGQNWATGDVTDGLNGSRILGPGPAEPAVRATDDLFVAFMKERSASTRQLRFLRGVDQGDGRVAFSYLTGPSPLLLLLPPVPVTLVMNKGDVRDLLPGVYGDVEPGAGFDLAVDPDGEDRLYIAYHDTATSDPNDIDVNVYVRTLTKSGSNWWLGDPVMAHDGSGQNDSDQFMPQIAVTNDGFGKKIHVVYYDDRWYNADDDQADGDPDAKFDLYYSQLNFDENDDLEVVYQQNLCEDPPNCSGSDPALDFSLNYDPDFRVRDYNGITFFEQRGCLRVMTTAMGMSSSGLADSTVVWISGLVICNVLGK